MQNYITGELLQCIIRLNRYCVRFEMLNLNPNSLRFSGHETFPIRQLWLSKVFHFVTSCIANQETISFNGEQTMIKLGVGKNMVASMRFWAEAVGFITNKDGIRPTDLGQLVLGMLDPNSEHPSTAWLVHWNLASQPSSSTVFWFLFNQINSPIISRDEFQTGLRIFADRAKKKVSDLTIKRDVEVCLRSYVPFLAGRNKVVTEEFVEPLLASLGIVKVVSKDVIEIPRNSRPTLNNALFAYAIMDFWQSRLGNTSSLDFFQISHAIGSPGKVFRIDENSLSKRLEQLEELTNGEIIWTEQSGIKAVVRQKMALNDPNIFKKRMLQLAFK